MRLVYPNKTGMLCAKMEQGLTGQDTVNRTILCLKTQVGGGIAATLDASYYKGTGMRNGREREYLIMSNNQQSHRKYIVRRLTPIECQRLQGMPDCWFDGVDGSDSAKYKALGNGLALPCAYDVLNRIVRYMEMEKENDTVPCNNATKGQEVS